MHGARERRSQGFEATAKLLVSMLRQMGLGHDPSMTRHPRHHVKLLGKSCRVANTQGPFPGWSRVRGFPHPAHHQKHHHDSDWLQTPITTSPCQEATCTTPYTKHCQPYTQPMDGPVTTRQPQHEDNQNQHTSQKHGARHPMQVLPTAKITSGIWKQDAAMAPSD